MEEKILLVLGASSECGLAIIKRVHANYEYIYAHYAHSAEALMELKKELGDKLILIQADFSSDHGEEAVLNAMENGVGYPNHIIHLPAVPYRNVKFIKAEWEEFELGLHTSLRSAVIVIQKVVAKLLKERRQGKIIFMLSSSTNNVPPKFSSVYVTVKYALLGLMKALSVEYADRGIMVNGISPSMMETKFLKDVPELIVQQAAMNSPFGRNLLVEEIVPAFEFLLSEGGDRITGQNIVISGGSE